MSSSIKTINSTPKYISSFINSNHEQLNKIYNEGLSITQKKNKEFKVGILVFQCSEKQNIMDVQFADDEFMETILAKDSLVALKTNIPESKKLYFIFDIDLNSVFLVYI